MRTHTIILFFLTYLCGGRHVSAQTNSDKASQLVDSLSWNSIAINCMGGILILTHSDKIEKELLLIGKDATKPLISALRDKTKTVIAHIILTQIWEPENAKNSLDTKYIYKDCDDLIGWHHVYNGVVWDWHQETEQTIDETEIKKIKTYWSSKLIDKIPVQSLGTDAIFEELEKRDDIKFPCNKVYDNKSGSVKSSELFELLRKKADDPVLQKLWARFGNDSTVQSFNDCFFVSYGAEGLSFRFTTDSTLSTIFIDDPYDGELPYGLKLSDLRETVDKKIGIPFQSFKYADNIGNWYKEQSLFMDFDKNGRINKFYISSK